MKFTDLGKLEKGKTYILSFPVSNTERIKHLFKFSSNGFIKISYEQFDCGQADLYWGGLDFEEASQEDIMWLEECVKAQKYLQKQHFLNYEIY